MQGIADEHPLLIHMCTRSCSFYPIQGIAPIYLPLSSATFLLSTVSLSLKLKKQAAVSQIVKGKKNNNKVYSSWVSSRQHRTHTKWITRKNLVKGRSYLLLAAAAAAKTLQSCPTLCDPIDGNLPGSPIPGVLQARILEWVAISFSNA